jgi:hypothetical protein
MRIRMTDLRFGYSPFAAQHARGKTLKQMRSDWTSLGTKK